MEVLLKNLIPELNLWSSKILYNNNLTINYVDHPVLLPEKWRCRDSVIELLFNECCDPTGNTYDNHHFIYKYKTVNLDRLPEFDPILNRRIQIYRNRCFVYVADDPENKDTQAICNLVTPTYVIDGIESGDVIADMAGVQPTKYVTKYKSVIVTTGTDELHQELPDEPDPPTPIEPGAYTPPEDIFHFTEEELEMLEYMYYYRTGQFELIHCFSKDFYFQLRSPLSKWIYLYLQCYLFNVINYQYLNTITTDSDDLLRKMFEKHAQDRIYQYVQKQYCTIYNKIEEVGGQLRRVFENYTMPCLTFLSRRKITEQNLNDGKIILQTSQEDQPTETDSFEFIYDGVILKNGIDYEVINEGNLKETHAVVILKNPSKFQVGGKYHMMWSCLVLTTPKSRIKGFSDE